MTLVAEVVQCIIIDAGSKSLRMGYSGDDRPFIVIPSFAGVLPDGGTVFGDLALAHPRSKMKVKQIIGLEDILDLNLFERLVEHGAKEMGIVFSEYPVLIVESPLWNEGVRESLANLFFEKLEAPAIYFAASPVLSAFSQGKHSALIVDIGASAVRISAVHDGQLLKKSVQSSTKLGGDSLTERTRKLFESKQISLHIPQQVERKSAVGLGKTPEFDVKMLDVSESFIQYHTHLLCEEWKESMIQVSESATFDSKDLEMRPTKFYEFPDGFNQSYGLERYQLGECLFDPSKFQFGDDDDKSTTTDSTTADATISDSTAVSSGLAEMILSVITMLDADARSNVHANIILAGAGSSMSGLAERLSKHLGPNNRVHLATTGSERRYGAWIGGSILSSTSTFNSLWISKQNYKDKGNSVLNRAI